MDRFSFLNAAHTRFFAELYEEYLNNPDAVEPSWRAFFQGFDFANEYGDVADEISAAYQGGEKTVDTSAVEKEFAVLHLIDAYRTYGHLLSDINPLKKREVDAPDLSIEKFGLNASDLETTFDAAKEIGLPKSSLSKIVETLKNIYCSTTGIEFSYILDESRRKWISDYFEKNPEEFSNEQKKRFFDKLVKAAGFENFFHRKYVGQKRFSIEGLEAAIPALDALIHKAVDNEVNQVVIGMSHRGRLNILANIMNKASKNIFTEFDGKDYDGVSDGFDGDVKYHLGYSTEYTMENGKKVSVNLAPNPSHLETVGAVIEGVARSQQDRYESDDFSRVLPIALHGDAAIAGQGIVYEIVQMSKLRAYQTAGTIHVVMNNQVGFTTSNKDARSGLYSTSIAKVVDAPVIHVNADDTLAVIRAFYFALDYRMKFKEDVFIDLIGYRKYGHNEGDEPKFTQPLLYKLIAKHKNASSLFMAQLLEEKVIDSEFAKDLEDKYNNFLEEELATSKDTEKVEVLPFMKSEWEGFKIANTSKMLDTYDTKVSKEVLDRVATAITNLPEDKNILKKIRRLFEARNKMYYETDQLDWAMGELLAYGSLMIEGYDVRFSGQDVQRGTFSHRHAVVKTEDTEEEYTPLNSIENVEGQMRIFNSHLSEYAVLGFEYGYAMANPKALTIWEAQFGDFSNGAQIITDQYVSAGEDKWGIQNGIVMLLPHGYEHQGAEHSSARLERFLQLASTENMYVANCTTPANHFHMLRRQMVTDFRKPLIVMSPKSLLRHPDATSKISDFTEGSFQTIIDANVEDAAAIKTLVFVSGKFYYDLEKRRVEDNRNDVAIVRLEQLFPLDKERLKEIIAKYPNVEDYVWAQEEPKNMGAYAYMLMNLDFITFRLASPPVASAPAAGSSIRSKARYNQAIDKVFNK